MKHVKVMTLSTAVILGGWVRWAHADSLPPSVTACAALTDVLQRLACYDREVARFTTRPPAAATPNPSANVEPPVATGAPAPAMAPANPAATVASAAGGSAAAVPPPVKHVAARIVSLEDHGDDLIVRLDNGQIWEQVQKADASLGLRVGDRVTIDKGTGGSFWLAGPSQAVMQVKRNL